MFNEVVQLTGTLSAVESIQADLSAVASIGGAIDIPQIVRPAAYGGTYEVTPTADAQTLSTSNLYMTDDIIINPIPDNYGLITWNGSYLTVS